MKKQRSWHIHLILLILVALTLLPFSFVVLNAFRTNSEINHTFFAIPNSFSGILSIAFNTITEHDKTYLVPDDLGKKQELDRGAAFRRHIDQATFGIRQAWRVAIRRYMINSLFVVALTAFGVVFISSGTAYILARYRFFGHKAIFMFIISTMMFPGVLTLVPSFILIKNLGLINTYWAMILPYIAGGQVLAVFIFKSFFEGLPEDLFESARLDGAGHIRLYWDIVLPLSKPVFAVILIMNALGTWNNFLWPYIVNPDGKHHIVASGLYVLSASAFQYNYATTCSAYLLASIPPLILFVYATKPFIQGITSGAFKA